MNIALIEHAEDDIDDEDRCGDEDGGRGHRRLEGLGSAHERAVDRGRQAKLTLQCLDPFDRLTKRNTGRQIEEQGHRRELSLMGKRQQPRTGAVDRRR